MTTLPRAFIITRLHGSEQVDVEGCCQHEDVFNQRIDGKEASVVESSEIHWTVHGMDGTIIRRRYTRTVSPGTQIPFQ
jgi:hypothetical protein